MQQRLAAAVLGLATNMAAAQPWPALRVDPTMTTVSGLSSGGYMAVQLHVARSSLFRGVGVVAAGPWYCAEGQREHAVGRCLFHGSPIPVQTLQDTARRWAAEGRLDDLSGLATARVYLFSGRRDTAVKQSVSDDLARWYGGFVPAAQIRYRNEVDAEHGMVTHTFCNPCAQRGMPYIQNCGIDVAGELLAHLYGPLKPRVAKPAGRWLTLDQQRFIAQGRGMGRQARMYVAPGCERGGCRLHVVLHGCGQNLDDVGETYVQHTGYAPWADNNRLVLLYPQTSPEATHSCWDWWGYTGADYAQKSGAQIAAISRMVQQLEGR
jgi:poly(3-hydroxybutyrate) depolymerase